MRRRALLSLTAVGFAGCSGTRILSAQNASISPAESACPAPDDADKVICVPETDPGSVPVALTADSRSGSLPATFSMTLTNGSVQSLSMNPYGWSLWKRAADEWHHVAPGTVPLPLMQLFPGDSHEWVLTAKHEQPVDPGRYSSSWESAGTVAGLGGGEYAFTTDGWFGENSEKPIQFGVLLRFDAPELELEPTAAVTESSRDGDTVSVRGEGSDSEDARLAKFVLERIDDAADPRKLIPETAARDYRLRNTLPFFEEDVEQVRFVEENTVWPAFGVNEPYTISYEGNLFEVTASELETETETA